MKKIALSVAALALTAGSALAADLPSRKAAPILPPPPPAPLWTGFYVGLNAGYSWSNSNAVRTVAGPVWTDPAFPASAPTYAALSALGATTTLSGGSNGGFIGGGQVGYNWQFYNSFVAGIEADIQGLASNSTRNSVTTAVSLEPVFIPGSVLTTAVSASRNVEYIGTVRGRLGWLATPTLLIYGTGGLAYGGVSLNSSIVNVRNNGFQTPAIAGGALSDTRTGWAAGGGVEWMFWPNWSAKVEYLYYNLGSASSNDSVLSSSLIATGNPYTAVGVRTTANFNGNIVRAGLNYHFNWGAPAPVVAKY